MAKKNGIKGGNVVERTLEVELGEDEVKALGAQMADRELELIGVEQAKREASSDARKAIKEIRLRLAVVAQEISTGRGMRTLKVCEVKTGTTIQWFSPDGSVLYGERVMSAEEVQESLDWAEEQSELQ